METAFRPASSTAPSIPALLEIARTAALAAGEAILKVYASGDFAVEAKADASPLTRADKAAHQLITQHLAQTHLPVLSEEGAEIPYEERQHWDWFWLVDPLDGTKEFIKRNGEFTVNIALVQGQKPVAGVVYAPALHLLYYGSQETGVYKETQNFKTKLVPYSERRTLANLHTQPEITMLASRSHLTQETQHFMQGFPNAQTQHIGSSLKFMLLAEGKADLNPRFGPTMEWDTAASHALLNALNRGVYTTDLQAELVYNKPHLLNPSFVAF